MEDLSQWLQPVWSVIVTTVIGLIATWCKDLKHRWDDEQEEKAELLRTLVKQTEELKLWRERMDAYKKENDEQLAKQASLIEELKHHLDAIRRGGLAILRDRIYQGCKHFNSLGQIPSVEKHNLSDMFSCYSEWGGNGVVADEFRVTDMLPVVSSNLKAMPMDFKKEMNNGGKI